MSDWAYFGLFFVVLFALVGAADVVRRALHWAPEVTRKSVHVITALLVATTPFLFQQKAPLVVLASIFVVVNYVGVRFRLFQGMHGTERQTYGTVFFPLAFIALLYWQWDRHPLIIVLAMLVLGLADTVAALVGENVRNPHRFRLGREPKSLEGSVAMFAASFVIVLVGLVALGPHFGEKISLGMAVWAAFLAALFGTAGEAISFSGSDNFTSPLAVAFVLDLFLSYPSYQAWTFTFGTALAVVVAALSYRARFLDAGGAVLTAALGSVVFGLGGWSFTVPILTFFILSSLLSKVGRRRRESVLDVFEKHSTRDLAQVLANGGIAGLLVLAWFYLRLPQLYVLYLASLAAVTADTWGTELGVLSGLTPRSVLNWKRVTIGTSGGVTVAGVLGGVLGSLAIGLSGWLSAGEQFRQLWGVRLLLIVIAAGVLASLVDSFLGATVQAQHRCVKCGKVTEKLVHCGVATEPVRGLLWMNNDVVNGFCAFSGVVFAWAMIHSF
ncbi:MAG: DUF92 domain-containing protein [Calditrichaeota bacterium]|nr:DUF92 domain-containing protein [Calditrichota bacterium]